MKHLIIILALMFVSTGWAPTYNWENAPKEKPKAELPKSDSWIEITTGEFLDITPNLTINYSGDIHFQVNHKDVSLQKELNYIRKEIETLKLHRWLLVFWCIFINILIFILRRKK